MKIYARQFRFQRNDGSADLDAWIAAVKAGEPANDEGPNSCFLCVLKLEHELDLLGIDYPEGGGRDHWLQLIGLYEGAKAKKQIEKEESMSEQNKIDLRDESDYRAENDSMVEQLRTSGRAIPPESSDVIQFNEALRKAGGQSTPPGAKKKLTLTEECLIANGKMKQP